MFYLIAGVDVTANQDEISDHETFQLEFDWTTKRWYIRTMQDRYWTLETAGGIQAAGDKRYLLCYSLCLCRRMKMVYIFELLLFPHMWLVAARTALVSKKM